MQRFNYSSDEQIFINKFDKLDSKYWESSESFMGTIKGKIRSYFLPIQNNQCCYCKMLKQEKNGKTWNIEHIFPRDLYPQFTFTPENLAISCIECNNFKLAQDVKKNKPPIKRYPKTGSNVTIVHPHFDNYDDHIKINRDPDGRIFHTPINQSKKGRNTIVMCNLFRFQEEAFGLENQYQKSIEKHISKVLTTCLTNDMTSREIELLVKAAVNSSMNL